MYLRTVEKGGFMPQRKNVRTINSEKVQGEGSFIRVRGTTVKETREAVGQGSVADDAPKEERIAAYDRNLDFLLSHVLDWNWVDDEGKPLPIPRENAEVKDMLTSDEVGFIGDAITGSGVEELKN
jgi:hypothetical protein